MEDLKIIGENNIVELLEVKGIFFDVFDDVLSLLYLKREGLATKEILAKFTIDYNYLYRFLTKLVSLEIIKPESDQKFVFTQKGIDVYKAISQLDFSAEQIRSLGKKHALSTLKTLESHTYIWNDLNKVLHIGQSSMKNALDTLIDADLIKKSTDGYGISETGTALITSLQECYNKKYTPVFEIQAKFSIKASDKQTLLNIIRDRFKEEDAVIQQDYYILPGTDVGKQNTFESYLRYRRESIEKQSIKTPPSHYLTWIKINNRSHTDNVWILNRSREEIRVEYPSIIYFIEYLGAKIVKKIIKRRESYKNQDVKFHFDDITSSNQPDILYIEIKSKAWDAPESKDKVKIINGFFDEISNAIPVKSIDKSYSDFL
jgi:predicted transcriptional regulator/adenylate cyclase class IV